MTEGTLAALLDRAQIADLVASLAHAQDNRDWAAFRELFADRVLLNLSGHLDQAAVEMTAEELASLARSTLDGFDATHHATSNVLLTFEDDEASCRIHVIAYHHVPADPSVVDFCTMRGYWQLGMRKVRDRWRIHAWSIVRSGPYDGDPAVYQLAAARTRPTPERLRKSPCAPLAAITAVDAGPQTEAIRTRWDSRRCRCMGGRQIHWDLPTAARVSRFKSRAQQMAECNRSEHRSSTLRDTS